MENDFLQFRLIRFILLIIVCLLIALGSAVLFGWVTYNTHLIQVDTFYPPMQLNTSLCFLFSGLTLLFILLSLRRVALIMACIVLFLSGLAIVQNIFNVHYIIDFLRSNYGLPLLAPAGPNTAVCFLLIGVCLVLTTLPYKMLFSFLVEIFCCISGSIAAISLFGYIFKLYSLTSWFHFPSMAIHSAIGIILVSLGLFLCHTVYSFHKENFLYGPIIGSIFLTTYLTIFLWQGFETNQYLAVQRQAQNNADFLAYSLRKNISDLSHALKRIALRWEVVKGYNQALWDIDYRRYKDDIHALTRINWYDKNLRLQSGETLNPVEVQKDALLMQRLNAIKSNKEKNPVTYHLHDQIFLFLLPLYVNEDFDGILVTTLNVQELIKYIIDDFFHDYYLKISEGNRNIYTKMTDSPLIIEKGGSSVVDSPLGRWTIQVIPTEKSLLQSFLPNLILILGFFSTIFLAFLIYLLQLVFHTKQKVLAALKEKADDLAYRQAILDSSNYSVISTDSKGTILSFNKAAERMLLWKADEMIGKATPEVFHDNEEVFRRAKQLSRELNETISPGFDVFTTMAKREVPDEREWTYVRKDGSRFLVKLSVTAVKNLKGELIGFVGIAYDLTEVKKIEYMKNELIAITSHELRSPLTSIKGALEIISDSKAFTVKEKSLIDIAHRSCDRLIRLTNDILDIQKMESGKLEFLFTDFHLKDMLDKSVEMNQFLAQKNEIVLKNFENVPDYIINGDEDRILQVMANFITNAIKNSPKNSEVSFVVSRHGPFVRVGIKDRGPGIPDEYHGLIFQKFSQVPSRQRIKEGTGLGLSICKVIIEKHGGRVGFDTNPQGSTFWFELLIKP